MKRLYQIPACLVEQAAQFEGVLPPLSVAVEDSASGVGSADAADMGMIVGYVGASHISDVSAFLSSSPCRDGTAVPGRTSSLKSLKTSFGVNV